jgi:hypothetical protein
MSDNPTPTPPTDPAPKAGEGGDGGKQQEQTFTQADLDRVVRERVQRERAKFADYDDLKAKAGEKATADERLAELEKRYAAAEARALRADIANAHGITPEDRDLFLTGTDEETLTAQAKRLAERVSDRKKANNVVPREGANPNPKAGDDGLRDFTRNLFNRANAD